MEENKDVLEPEDSNEVQEDQVEQPDEENVQEEDNEIEDQPGEGNDEEEVDRNIKRPVHTVPIRKYNEERKAWREEKRAMEATIEKLKKAPPQTKKQVRELAKKHGLTEEAAEALWETVTEAVAPLNERFQEQELKSHQREVQDEFDRELMGRVREDFPGATPEFINEVKESVVGLAFSSKYNTYRLGDIYEINKRNYQFQNRHTAEDSGGSGRPEIVDFRNVTDEDIERMDAQEFEAYSNQMAFNESKWKDGGIM